MRVNSIEVEIRKYQLEPDLQPRYSTYEIDSCVRITIIIINSGPTDCYASGADAPYGCRHVVPLAASLAGV